MNNRMATKQQPSIQDFAKHAKTGVVTTLVSIVIIASTLVYSANELSKLSKAKIELQAELSRLQIQAERLTSRNAELELKLQKTTNVMEFSHPIDLMDVKKLCSTHYRECRILDDILELRNRGVKWKVGGQNPTEGFDSPNFALYILKNSNISVPSNLNSGDVETTANQLLQVLQPADHPSIGDLLFYPTGYVMFYFLDQDQKPYVIGMTPLGIISLDPQFGKFAIRRPKTKSSID